MSGGGTVHPHGLYSERSGRQIAAPTGTSVGDTVHPHRLFSQRGMAMDHRRYIAWFYSSTGVITWDVGVVTVVCGAV